MCLNKSYVKSPYLREPLLVKCGHCPACLQEKAIARTNRIRNQSRFVDPRSSSARICVFLTLTYSNDTIPYISLFDMVFTKEVNDRYKMDDKIRKFDTYVPVPVYRDYKSFRGRSDSDYHFQRKRKEIKGSIDTVNIPWSCIQKDNFKTLRKKQGTKYIHLPDKVGICYYDDIKNFKKRLRDYIKRHYNGFPFEIYTCSEYGPKTTRPHFHGLATIPASYFEEFKCAVSKAWTLDDSNRTKRNVEIARNAASYVASYVNCDATVPSTFKVVRALRPKHSFSKGFGANLRYFLLDSLREKIYAGDLGYDWECIREGVLSVERLLFPKYVISRFFPKFKRFNCFTSHEIESLYLRPELIYRFKTSFEYTQEDCDKIVHLLYGLRSKQLFSLACDGWPVCMSTEEYAFLYSRVWSVYASNVLMRNYKSIDVPSQNFYAYDNIRDYFEGSVLSPSLDDCLKSVPPDFGFVMDYNAFPDEMSKDYRLTQAYNSYSKDRKIRNIVYSNLMHV